MKIRTTRFGLVEIAAEDVILFPSGLIGFEDERRWVILADDGNDAVAWLQSASRAEIALPVASPRRFVPDYRVRVTRNQVETLAVGGADSTFVLAIIGREGGTLTLNLKAPLIVNLSRAVGRQVVTSDDQPLQYRLDAIPQPLRMSA